jgi:hypothetical protein
MEDLPFQQRSWSFVRKAELVRRESQAESCERHPLRPSRERGGESFAEMILERQS